MHLTFTAGDVDAAIDIMREAARWQIGRGTPLWGLETLTRARLDNPAGEFIVAWADGTQRSDGAPPHAAACCLLSFEDKLFWPEIPAGASGFLHKLAVRRKFAGTGVAARLAAHAERLCREKGVPMLRLDTDLRRPKLCAIYEGLGFRRVGVRAMRLPQEGLGQCDVALYEKTLPMRVDPAFYARDVLDVAPALLGKLLCRRLPDGDVLRRRVTETEAYRGAEDTACHAHAGKTRRTAVMFGPGGFSYVYLCYGVHSLLNIVTGGEGQPQAALVRGVEGHTGPGRVTKAMAIDRSLGGVDMRASEVLWVEEDGFAPASILTGPRVGIGYASEEDRGREWRFRAG
ncbi:MAG: DNA-3-methyladenine glycosylase [Oscillospiraceae bacterium]|jgi:DNA-3-methyladenine glycosylase|nr:DNA-3-methyladenine glycosylase [Oscillospiraceae bacterium]